MCVVLTRHTRKLGVDVAETALAIAREKVGDRGIEVEFAAADAFQLERLGLLWVTGGSSMRPI